MVKDVGRSPSGSGQSAKPEPVPVSAVPATVPNAVTHASKAFSVYGMPVTRRQIADAIDMLANLPNQFVAMDLVPAVLPGATFHQKQEALNRLFQRWRKLGLAEFRRGRWTLTRNAWGVLQASAIEAREGDDPQGRHAKHESAVPKADAQTTPNEDQDHD